MIAVRDAFLTIPVGDLATASCRRTRSHSRSLARARDPGDGGALCSVVASPSQSKRISAELGEEDGSEAGVQFLLQARRHCRSFVSRARLVSHARRPATSGVLIIPANSVLIFQRAAS